MRNIGLFPILDSDEIFIDAHQAPADRRKMSRLDSGATALIFAGMSVARELGRRLRADRAPPRYEPCLPRPAKEPPAGPGWIHEIKHDGFRIVAHRDGDRVRLVTRNGYDFADRFPLAVAAVAGLPVRSCVIDGEGIACDESGLSVFELPATLAA